MAVGVQFDRKLRAAQLAEEFVFAHKDELTAEFEAANKGRRPKMPQILDAVCARLANSPQARVLMFNMNINLDWMKGLLNMLRNAGVKLKKVVVLHPPQEFRYRQLQAAAVILRSQPRAQEEPADMRSTLEPAKAWEVIMGPFFGDPNKFMTLEALQRCVGAIEAQMQVVGIAYPVPLLKQGIEVPDEAPTTHPQDWQYENIVFPEEQAYTTTFEAMQLAVSNTPRADVETPDWEQRVAEGRRQEQEAEEQEKLWEQRLIYAGAISAICLAAAAIITIRQSWSFRDR